MNCHNCLNCMDKDRKEAQYKAFLEANPKLIDFINQQREIDQILICWFDVQAKKDYWMHREGAY